MPPQSNTLIPHLVCSPSAKSTCRSTGIVGTIASLLPAFVLLLGALPHSGLADTFVLPKAETRALPERSANGRDYLLYVSFPLSYDTADAGRRYPVIYVCDGYWDFSLIASTADFIRRDGHAPEAIVVGIGYGGVNPDVGLLRQWDLTPGIDEQYDSTGEKTGHAQEFLAVIANEIIPFVERTYRADPAFRVLLGSSFGGLFAHYAAFERPGLFQAHVSSSPALYWSDEYVLSRARDHAASGAELNARMFVGWGSGDSEKLIEPARRFAQEVAKLKIPGLRLVAREIEGGGHNGSKPECFTRGLRYAFAPQSWEPPVGPDPGYGALGKLVNLSTRGLVQGGERALIGGFVVGGILPKRILVRAAGPSLGQFGIASPLSDPRLRVVNGLGATVAENDNWGGASTAPAVSEATLESGAFGFSDGSLDAALVVALDPGTYTVIVSGAGSSQGIALVEAYELGP